MKQFYFIFQLIFTLTLLHSCNNQTTKDVLSSKPSDNNPQKNNDEQIAEYIVEIFEDSKKQLWFGTMAKGVARYDGDSLVYFTKDDGLPSNAVVQVAEDKNGNIWLATQEGLSKFDGVTFTNFSTDHGLPHFRISNILFDSDGNLWIGTWGGVGKMEATSLPLAEYRFTNFPLPIPDVELLEYQTTMDWITEIMEDQNGNIWFGRDGYGACKYDPAASKNGKEPFTHFTKKEGLVSNNIQSILADKKGNIWFGARIVERDHPDPDKRTGAGGLSKYDDEKMTQFPDVEGLTTKDIYTIYEDKKNQLWIGMSGFGVYRYDGSSFQLFKETNRMDLTYTMGLQGFLEDHKGNYWLGFSGGLFRLIDSSIVNVTKSGPWN